MSIVTDLLNALNKSYNWVKVEAVDPAEILSNEIPVDVFGGDDFVTPLQQALQNLQLQEEEVEKEEEEKQSGEESPEDAQESDVVVEPSSLSSEEVHGGDEASGDIEDSPNAFKDGQEESNTEEEGAGGEGEACDDSSESSSEEEYEEEYEDTFNDYDVSEDDGSSFAVDDNKITLSESKARSIIRKFIWRLAEGASGKRAGSTRWDKRKIINHLTLGQEWKLPRDKYSKNPDGVLFYLDFSGSVAALAADFGVIGQAVCEMPGVTVAYGGNEGYIQGVIDKKTDIKNTVGKWYDDGIPMVDWLKKNHCRTVVIFGDYDGTRNYVDAYEKHRSTNFIWFNPCGPDYDYSWSYGSAEIPASLKKKIKSFSWDIKNLAKAVKTI